MNTIEQAREVSARIWVAGYLDESATIDALIADRNEWRDEALSAQERFKAAEDKLASIKGQEPVGYAYAHQDCIGSVIGAKGQWAPDEIPLFLAAGAQPVQQEPVMQHCPNCNHEQMALSVDCGNCGNVYDAAPVQAQERKPLTDELVRLANVALREMPRPSTDWHEAAKRVCQFVSAHGIKEQP